jgi:APA family basic amino acid/polyamine antiporter
MINLPVETWIRFLVWLAVGAVLYFGYGRQRSRLTAEPPKAEVRSGF